VPAAIHHSGAGTSTVAVIVVVANEVLLDDGPIVCRDESLPFPGTMGHGDWIGTEVESGRRGLPLLQTTKCGFPKHVDDAFARVSQGR
jgi:hypothetical protein